MKVIISIPDRLMKRVIDLARRRNISRSRVFIMAVELMFRRLNATPRPRQDTATIHG